MKKIISISFIALSFTLNADKINIANKTDKDVYAAFYYTKGVTSERMQNSEPFLIAAGQTKSIERPDLKLYVGGTYDRDLYFAYTQDFPNTIHKGDRHFVNLGSTRGSDFYIAENERKELDGYNTVTWLSRPVVEAIKSSVYEINRGTLVKAPYVTKDAQVRQGNSLSPQELQYVQQRAAITEKALNTLVETPIKTSDLPRIAICCSGGGYRAMITTAGFINGADKIGLLNALTYQAGLSGSTWAMSGWLQSGKSIDSFLHDLYGKLSVDIKSDVDVLQISNALLNNLSFNIPISPIDIWGSLIAQKVLLPNSGKFTIADLTEKMSPSRNPFPIFTAVITSPSMQDAKPWVEFTPYEVGSTYLNASIPVWAFGRKFEKGASSKQSYSIYPPAQPLSFCMGIWGSAIAVNVEEFINDKFGKVAPKEVLSALKGSAITGKRIAAPDIFNWTFGINGAPLSDLPKFELIDAGLDFNLPLPPLLRPERAVDIIIVLDASASNIVNPAAQLKLAEKYAQKNNLKFPTIDYNATKNNCSVHYGDPKTGTPTIIYVPVIANPGYQNGWYLDPKDSKNYTSTNNFKYTDDQVMQLSGLTEYTVIASKEIIKEAIKQVALKKAV